MTEVQGATTVVAGTPTFGARLAAERTRLGLSVGEMAARLRLHPRQIDAIEHEALDRLPSGPFVRGFVRNYAKEVKLDPEPLLSDLNRRLAPAEEADSAPQPAASPSPSPTSPHSRAAARERISRRLVIFVVLAVLFALAVIGSFGPMQERADPPPKIVTAVPAPAAPAAPTDAAPQSPPAPDLTPPADVTAPTAAAATTVGAATPAVRPAGLRLVFNEESWVEVTQGDGRVLLSQLNAAGSEQRLEGAPPLKLVIGNAAAVTLEFRGKRIDLAPRTSVDNVARLTLN